MSVTSVFFFFSFVIGCLAVPTPEYADIPREDLRPRVVGGMVAAPGSHPHMVALTHGILVRTFFCGGSVIATRTVLTAAHCIDVVYSYGSLSRSLRVTVGTNQWKNGGTSYSVSGNATHPHWSASTLKNDIGILHTTSAIVYDDLVQPVPVSYYYVGGEVEVNAAGWGRTSVFGPLSEQLLDIDLTTISAEKCARDLYKYRIRKNMRYPAYEPSIELCTFHSRGHGMCRGDSGSGLTRLDDGSLIGVVSWGLPCAVGAPDVYARVSAFEPWIQMNTRL